MAGPWPRPSPRSPRSAASHLSDLSTVRSKSSHHSDRQSVPYLDTVPRIRVPEATAEPSVDTSSDRLSDSFVDDEESKPEHPVHEALRNPEQRVRKACRAFQEGDYTAAAQHATVAHTLCRALQREVTQPGPMASALEYLLSVAAEQEKVARQYATTEKWLQTAALQRIVNPDDPSGREETQSAVCPPQKQSKIFCACSNPRLRSCPPPFDRHCEHCHHCGASIDPNRVLRSPDKNSECELGVKSTSIEDAISNASSSSRQTQKKNGKKRWSSITRLFPIRASSAKLRDKPLAQTDFVDGTATREFRDSSPTAVRSSSTSKGRPSARLARSNSTQKARTEESLRKCPTDSSDFGLQEKKKSLFRNMMSPPLIRRRSAPSIGPRKSAQEPRDYARIANS